MTRFKGVPSTSWGVVFVLGLVGGVPLLGSRFSLGNAQNVLCPDPIPFHAYVASSGSDVTGNGSSTCPFATVQMAQATVAAAPTTQAEFLQPRVIEVYGPGAFPGDLDLPTLNALSLVVGEGASLTGKITWTLDDALRFGATSAFQPLLYVGGPTIRETTSIGDGANAISVVTVSATPTLASLYIGRIRMAGSLTADAATTYLATTFRDVSLTSTTSHVVDDGGVGHGIKLSAYDSVFQKQIQVGEIRTVVGSRFHDHITYYMGGGDTSRGVYGIRNSFFGATPRSIYSNGPVRLDAESNYALKVMGWSLHPNAGGNAGSVVVQLQTDMTPIVPTP